MVRLLHLRLARHDHPKVFFAGLDPTAALVAALGLFAAGFAFRPLGAIIFGVIGDRLGRKGAFLTTVSLMGGVDLPDRRAADLRHGRDHLARSC